MCKKDVDIPNPTTVASTGRDMTNEPATYADIPSNAVTALGTTARIPSAFMVIATSICRV